MKMENNKINYYVLFYLFFEQTSKTSNFLNKNNSKNLIKVLFFCNKNNK
jgi:hypothetical protein